MRSRLIVDSELYQHQADHHIIPSIGHLRLADLRARDIQKMVDKIVASGHIPTANKCRTLLSTALKWAVRQDLIDRNPVERIDPVREEVQQPDLWTPQQARTFLESIEDHRFFPAFYTLLSTGLRRGELLGLRWVDIEAEGLWVRQTVKIVNNRPFIGPTKTRASRRYVALAPDTIAVLQKHRRQQLADRELLGDA